MQIVYHLGAHCTDEGGLLRVLLRNRALLLDQGTAVPEPDRYPALLRAAAAVFAGRAMDAAASETLLDGLLPAEAEDAAQRLVLSFEGFLAFPRDAVTQTQLYPAAGIRARGLAAMFPGAAVEFHIAIRNPATFIPALSARRKAKGQEPVPDGFDAGALRWSELVGRIRAAVPGVGLTVWCDEDTPLIWHSVLRAVAGHDESIELANALDLPASLMSVPGQRRMAAWFAETQPVSDEDRRAGMADFLDRFALPEKLEVEVDMPGWTDDTIASLTASYDQDCARIAAMEGVRFIAP